ncbi:Asp-tRNA(Asn)/Glu-tRNA(Gln) amidotransferase subunit GatC [Candidatus Woesearchaeota archaeon]|nr:Asp-tRNA(Asn)/Glu-tRNA(Gln) amidotransferase subunit GatC [Candidatus Woesearchaeota archaeon]
MDTDTIARVARLARLSLTAAEKEAALRDMGGILDAFSLLETAETGPERALHPLQLPPRLREDIAGSSLSQEEALANARSKEGYIKAGRVR